MSAANVHPASAMPAQPLQMQPPPQHAGSPPSKKDLSSWWKTFKKNSKKEEEKGKRLGLSFYYLVRSSMPEISGRESVYTSIATPFWTSPYHSFARLCNFMEAFVNSRTPVAVETVINLGVPVASIFFLVRLFVQRRPVRSEC